MRLGRRAALLGGLACVAAAPVQSIPIETAGGRHCILPVVMDGKPGKMLLDTGSQRTIVTRAALARLGLRLDPRASSQLQGAGGGSEEHQNATVGTLTAGGLRLVQRAPGAPFSMPVTSLDLGESDGLLGGDVLTHQTVDLDIPNLRLALLPPSPSLQGPVRLWRLRGDLLLALIRLDGLELVALLDTGASNSLITAGGIHRLGLAPEALAGTPVVPSFGLGGAFTAHTLRFGELRLGPVTVPRPRLLLADVSAPAHLLLGLDVLGRQRFVLSYASLTLSFPSA